MDKGELIAALDTMGRGARADLARHMGVHPTVMSKMLKTKRPFRHDEVMKIRAFLLERAPDSGLNPHARVLIHDNMTVKLRQLDGLSKSLVPLWLYAQTSDDGGVRMGIAATKSDWEEAPGDLKEKKSSFAVPVWDDSNAPWVRRGSTMFITRITGKDNEWHVFGRASGRARNALQGPVLGMLLGRSASEWRVQIGTRETSLSMADYPDAWRIAFFRQ